MHNDVSGQNAAPENMETDAFRTARQQLVSVFFSLFQFKCYIDSVSTGIRASL